MATDLSKAKFKILGTNEPVPEGYVCLGERWPAKSATARDRERVRRGIAQTKIDAYRRMRFQGDDDGPIYVCESDCAKWLATYDQQNGDVVNVGQPKSATQRQCSDRQVESVCESLASINTTLDEIYRVIERLTAAVESIATQPKTPQQELLHTMNSNGFHS